MDTFIQQLINGLVLGSIYALVALGYTMVYGIMGLINFAHGEVVMMGALSALAVMKPLAATGLPGPLVFVIALAVAAIVCMILGFTIERVAYRPLRNAPRLAPLITAIGVSLLLQNLGVLVFGANPRPFPNIVMESRYELGGVVIT